MSWIAAAKSAEALTRGYVLFRVNGRYFLRYSAAHRECELLHTGEIALDGLHVLKGWRGFFLRMGGDREAPTMTFTEGSPLGSARPFDAANMSASAEL